MKEKSERREEAFEKAIAGILAKLSGKSVMFADKIGTQRIGKGRFTGLALAENGDVEVVKADNERVELSEFYVECDTDFSYEEYLDSVYDALTLAL